MTGGGDVEYAKIATYDDADSVLPNDEMMDPEENGHATMVHAIRNDNPFPISRPPTKYRDAMYGLLFILHFVGILLLTLIEQKSLKHAVLNFERVGSWASIVMNLTLLSTLTGAGAFFLIKHPDVRAFMISYGILFSQILKICMGNILLIMRSKFSLLGLLFILSAILDGGRYRPAKTAQGFTNTLLQLSLDVNAAYGIGLVICCIGIIAAQTCVLLWWASFYIGLLATVSPANVAVMTIVMMLSLYWTAQFFHHFVGFVIGGCTLWYFAKDDNEPIDRANRILLYTQCALTTSFGSLAKAALFIMPSQFILHFHAWLHRNFSASSLCMRCLRCCGPLGDSLLRFARRFNKLSICSMAVYGRTLLRTADDQLTYYPGTLKTSQEEYTSYSLGCISTCLAGLISIIFGLCAESKELYSWPLFFCMCFYLSYFGVNIALHVYSSAVDAFIIAAAINPRQFAKENQLVLLRFMRTGDPDLEPL